MSGLQAAGSQQNKQHPRSKPWPETWPVRALSVSVDHCQEVRQWSQRADPAKEGGPEAPCEFPLCRRFSQWQPANQCKAQRVRRGQRLRSTVTPWGHLVCAASTSDQLYWYARFLWQAAEREKTRKPHAKLTRIEIEAGPRGSRRSGYLACSG